MPTFENLDAPEHLPVAKPKNEIVETFRTELDAEFIRFQTFYDRSNVVVRDYRINHVNLVTSVYNSLMTIFGNDVSAVYALFDELNVHLADRAEAGGEQACIERIADEGEALGILTSNSFQACALTANTTFSGLLTTIFYPTFNAIQAELSEVPIAVIDALSRGNVLSDEQEIVEYLRNRFEVFDLQWLGAVSQLFRWETSRFESEGMFAVDEATLCLADALIHLIFNYSRLLAELRDC